MAKEPKPISEDLNMSRYLYGYIAKNRDLFLLWTTDTIPELFRKGCITKQELTRLNEMSSSDLEEDRVTAAEIISLLCIKHNIPDILFNPKNHG